MAARCDSCAYCVKVDDGFSNESVVGTYLFCAKNLHDEMPYENFLGNNPHDKFAENCASYEHVSESMQVWIDCDLQSISLTVGPNDPAFWEYYCTQNVTSIMLAQMAVNDDCFLKFMEL